MMPLLGSAGYEIEWHVPVLLALGGDSVLVSGRLRIADQVGAALLSNIVQFCRGAGVPFAGAAGIVKAGGYTRTSARHASSA